MSLSRLRSALYRLASLLGDVNAARQGRLGERLVRKTAWRVTGRLLNTVFRPKKRSK